MRGTKSKVRIGKKLTKKTNDSLDFDNKNCNKSTIQKIMKATEEELLLNLEIENNENNENNEK